MKTRWKVAIWCLVFWVLAIAVDNAVHAGELVLSLGVGTIGEDQLYDDYGESVHGTGIGRAELSFQHYVNPHVGFAASAQHFSSLDREDPGFNWAGIELQVKFP